MLMRLLVFIGICSAVLIGVYAFDQPALKVEDFWSKAGVDSVGTRDQLYRECGYYNPPSGDGVWLREEEERWLTAYKNAERCMLDNEFVYSDSLGGRAIGKCDQVKYAAFPSCRSLITVQRRDVGH